MKNISLNFLQSELNRVSNWIQFSDKKTAFLSAFYSAIFGLVFSQREQIVQNFLVYQKWIIYLYSFIFVGFVFSYFIGLFFLFRTVFPRLKNSFTDKSLFYFNHIANLKLIDYLKKIEKLSENEAKKQIIEQIYSNSIVAKQKMNNVQNAIKSFVVVIIFTILLFLFRF